MFFSKAVTFDEDDAIGAVSVARDAPRLTAGDAEFVDRLKAGEAAAYEMLVDRYAADIYGLTYRLTSDPDDAADLTQETFIRAFRSVAKFRGDSSLKTWLFRIAVNESRNRFRWWKRRGRGSTSSLDATVGDSGMNLGDTLADIGASPEEDAIRRERESSLFKALGDLKPVFREAVVLADIEGLSYEECAAALGTNVGTIKSRISRGREELRKRLKDL